MDELLKFHGRILLLGYFNEKYDKEDGNKTEKRDGEKRQEPQESRESRSQYWTQHLAKCIRRFNNAKARACFLIIIFVKVTHQWKNDGGCSCRSDSLEDPSDNDPKERITHFPRCVPCNQTSDQRKHKTGEDDHFPSETIR